MSKKDKKKRIAELERQQSILAATMRVLRKDFNTLLLSIVHNKIAATGAANSFHAGTIPIEKEQGKPERTEAKNYGENLGEAIPKQPENEAEQVETKPNKWCIYNKANNSLVLIADGIHRQYNSKEEAEEGICELHNRGLISGKMEQYDAVLVSEI